jgi:hypothetical protein
MARKTSKAEEVRPMEFGGEVGEKEFVEFDEAKSMAEDLTTVKEAEGATSFLQVEEKLVRACDALEQSMGGPEAAAESFAAPSDNPCAELSNIVGFGVGEKIVGGRFTGELAVKVYVREKCTPSQVGDAALVPEEIEGYPTDVEEVGDVSALTYTGRYRPAPGGSSIGHPRITAGTLGCLMVRSNNHLCILSNNHVLANSNNARAGDSALQPGPADGGRDPRDRIGALETFVPIAFGGTATNYVDAAAAWTSLGAASPKMHCYTINPDPVNPALGMCVRKCGRTTQGTLGVITGVHVTIRVGYGEGRVALFKDQVQIRGVGGDFSAGGDSGSLVVTAGSRQPVALLFAGGNHLTFANVIARVIGAVGIRRFLS